MTTNAMNTMIHVHSDGSTTVTPDCIISTKMLVDRAVELNMTSLALTDHGTNINKFSFAKDCKAAGIKPIFGIEAYFVKHIYEEIEVVKTIKGVSTVSFQKDNRNAHIIILAKNENGYKQINKIMSDSWEHGFYNKPRIDINMINEHLDENDIVITTACIGGIFKKYDYNELMPTFQRFLDAGNFYLEIHTHPNLEQSAYNHKMVDIHNELGIPLVYGSDTHAIDKKGVKNRSEYLKSKGMFYEGEEDWHVDFPSYEEVKMRFADQPDPILPQYWMSAIENANTIADECEEYNILEYELRIPRLKSMESLTQEQVHEELENIVRTRMEEYFIEENITDKQKYYDAINYELGEIKDCGMADYFLIHYEIVKLAIEKYGGVLTSTSRGSGPSYITNFFLGMTSLDKLKFEELPLFSDRFMSSIRILESRTPPDKQIAIMVI